MKLRDLWPFGSARKASNSHELLQELMGGRATKSGERVNWKTALEVATVFACTRVKANGLAQVPFKLMLESTGPNGVQRLPAREHPLYRVLHRRPNPWQTSFEYRQTIGLHLTLVQNHYSFKNMLRGQVMELIPLEPQYVQVKRADDGELTYEVSGANGKTRTFPAEAIWHVRDMAWNGWQGMEAVQLAREAIGLAVALESSQSALQKNGITTNGTYSVEGNLSPQQYKDLRQFIVDNQSGANKGMPMILDRGATWLQQAMTNVDAQHFESRMFQAQEICRALGVMPIMVGITDKALTFASAEQQFLAHVVHTMMPLYECIEQSADVNLITEADYRRGYYAKFFANGLLRGSIKDRSEYFAKALGSGGSPAWMTQDEVRDAEDMNPMGGAAAALPIATNIAPNPVEPDPDIKTQRDELHGAMVHALKRESPPASITLPSITIAPATVKAGDVHVTLPEGAIQVKTTVEPAQIKAGDVHIGATENHVTVQHPKKSVTQHTRNPQTLELERSETRFEAD